MKEYYAKELKKLGQIKDQEQLEDQLKINAALVTMGVTCTQDVLQEITEIIYNSSHKEKRTGNIGVPIKWGDGLFTMVPCEELFEGKGAKTFTQDSFLKIVKGENQFFIKSYLNNFSFELPIEIIKGPKWYADKQGKQTLSELVQHDFGNMIAAVPTIDKKQYCEMQCSFCELEEKKKDFSPDALYYIIEQQINKNGCADLTLSGGSLCSEDKGVLKFMPFINELKKQFGNDLWLEIEFTPPDKKEYLDKLIDQGMDAALINIETFNSIVAATVMKKKVKVGQEKYFETMEYLTKKGIAVSSLALIGLYPGITEEQHKQDILSGTKKLADVGATIVPQPYKPFFGTTLQKVGYKPCSPALCYDLTKEVVSILQEYQLTSIDKGEHGCSGCGKCSLDTNMAAVYSKKQSKFDGGGK